MIKRCFSFLTHVGGGVGAGAAIGEYLGINAIGWVGATCGGIAAAPVFLIGGGLLGLGIFLKRRKRS